MLKKVIFTAVVILPVFFAKAQISSLKENTTLTEKQESIIYKNFVGECDLIIAYSEESYWWANRKFYNLLALKKGTWFKGYLSSQRLRSGKWTYPKVKFKEVDADSAAAIITYLDTKGFYGLNRASLNITTREVKGKVQHFSISDAVNYKFEILVGDGLSIVESYAPDYFLEKIPEITVRASFIKYRDWFALKYKALEPIEE